MLGADGVVVGSRFWASAEALVHPGLQSAGVAASGDETVKTRTTDIVRHRYWPERFQIRVLRNAFTDRWHGREEALKQALGTEAPFFQAATAAGDATHASPIVGEAVGLVRSVEPAAVILERIVAEAEALLKAAARHVAPAVP
jgi:nitronate monooxygenase